MKQVPNPQSAIRNPKSGSESANQRIPNPKFEIRNPQFAILSPPFAIRHSRLLTANRYLLTAILTAVLALYLPARLLPPPDLTASSAPSNLILDRHGRLLYEWVDPNGAQHRPVPLDAIAPACVQATIATEDSRFFYHPGVDPIAVARSLYRHWRYGQPLTGASTLTQQLVRITLLSPQERYRRSLGRKLKEAWLAWRLERHLSKEEILALYLNRAYYGNFAVGIEAAAHAYFGQPARTLDLAQCALLVGLPQAPAEWNPLVHPLEARARQRIVLDRMLAEGMITPEERQRALAEPLHFAATPFPIEAPHFVAMVQAELEDTLGVEAIRAGGWVITTTLDLDLQKRAGSIVRHHLYTLNHDPKAPPDRRVTSAAVVTLDPRTGEVLALVGSPDYFDRPNAGAVNGALALRQPGSAIKPLVYAAAFDPSHPTPWSPATIILDERTRFPTAEGVPYVPQNYDLKWHGPVPARVALAASFNVPAVKALQHAGLDRFLALADRLGLTSLARTSSPGLSLALGTGEVSLLELTAAYAALANGGHPVRPRLILEMANGRMGESANGETTDDTDATDDTDMAPGESARSVKSVKSVVGASANQRMSNGTPSQPNPKSQTPNPKSEIQPALDPRVAYLITDILSDREARVPTFGLNSPLELDRPAAAKTGTTTDWRDAWTVGYTPDRVTGVWVGNFDNTPMMYLGGVEAAAPIWRAVMTFAHRGLPRRPFPRPEGLETVTLCADTGLPATPDCLLTREEIVIAGVDYQVAEWANQRMGEWRISESAQQRTANYPLSAPNLKSPIRNSKSEIRNPKSDIPNPPSEIRNPKSEIRNPTSDIFLLSPDPYSEYRLVAGLPPDEQAIRLEVNAPAGSRVVFLVDGEVVAERARGPYTAWWPLQAGEHTITARVSLSDGRVMETEAVPVRVRGPGTRGEE